MPSAKTPKKAPKKAKKRDEVEIDSRRTLVYRGSRVWAYYKYKAFLEGRIKLKLVEWRKIGAVMEQSGPGARRKFRAPRHPAMQKLLAEAWIEVAEGARLDAAALIAKQKEIIAAAMEKDRLKVAADANGKLLDIAIEAARRNDDKKAPRTLELEWEADVSSSPGAGTTGTAGTGGDGEIDAKGGSLGALAALEAAEKSLES